MKNSMKIFSCLLAFLLLISGCSSPPARDVSSSQSSSSEPEPVIQDVAFTFSKDGKEAGTSQVLRDQSENYAFGVCFPAFDNDTVDQAIRLSARELIWNFQKQISSYSAASHGRRASLKVDYQDHLIGDHIVALILNAQADIPGTAALLKSTQAHLYDLHEKKPLGYEYFFQDGTQDSVFARVLAHFPTDDASLSMDSSQFSGLFASAADALADFVLCGDDAVFYYDQPALFTAQSGQLAIRVPLSELDGLMKVDKDGNVKAPPKKEEPEQEVTPPAVTPPANPQPQSGTVDPSRPMVALTFDDGPSRVTPRILDTLEQYNARATFFVVGRQVNSYYENMRRAVSLGCEIGNHTVSHASLPGLDLNGLASEIGSNNQRICDYISYTPALFRPPYGAANDTVRANAGMPMILWNIDTEDWKSRNAQSVISRALDHVKDGDIILMHDLYGSTAEACETIIPELINRGFQLVTVSEMAQAKGVSLESGQLYYSIR